MKNCSTKWRLRLKWAWPSAAARFSYTAAAAPSVLPNCCVCVLINAYDFRLLIFRVHFDIWWIALPLLPPHSAHSAQPLALTNQAHFHLFPHRLFFFAFWHFPLHHYNEVSITSFVSVAATLALCPTKCLTCLASSKFF